jgi:hypothetical protein
LEVNLDTIDLLETHSFPQLPQHHPTGHLTVPLPGTTAIAAAVVVGASASLGPPRASVDTTMSVRIRIRIRIRIKMRTMNKKVWGAS